MTRHAKLAFFTVIMLLCSAVVSFGASITPKSLGNGIFSIMGDSMDGVAGIDFNVSYPSSLSGPTVTSGPLISGALMTPNLNYAPGVIKIAIITSNSKGFTGSGEIARISFTNKGSGTVTVSVNNLISSSGTSVAGGGGTASNIQTPGIPFSDPAINPITTTTNLGTNPTAPATTAATTGGLTVTMPGDNPPKGEEKEAKTGETQEPAAAETPVASPETAAKASETQVVAKVQEQAAKPTETNQTYGSVLDRFRTYQGEKSPAIMTALFSKAVATSILQEPAIAISNGKTNVKINAELASAAGASPNFALSGARMVSLKKDFESGKWVLETLPQANSMTASVTILNGNSVIEFPLTVVPPVAGVSAQEADFAAFLKDSGTKPPKHDLNGDGRHDYLDDFIYTAHYLIKKNSGQQPKK